MDARIAQILEKLGRVRDARIETFGAEAHRYALAAPLGEDELRALEATHGITLPEGYRPFLRHAGRRGAGPYVVVAAARTPTAC